MKFYHGAKKNGPYFEGWYFKHQSPGGKSLALIPAFHTGRDGRRSASLQIITDDKSWWLEYPAGAFQASTNSLRLEAGPVRFHERGMEAGIRQDGLSLQGELRYGPFSTLRSDIMGPFRFFPGMQCAHGVVSMGHSLAGSLRFNGELLDFSGGTGYIETDRGRSFPNAYLWTQCAWPDGGSLMLAIASVPMPAGGFTGCICGILHQDREYRLATYRGARIENWSAAGASVRQGRLRLRVEVLEERRQVLRAPVEGRMERGIHESLCAAVRYRLWSGETLLFQHTDRRASFEYSDQRTAQ